MNRIVIRCCLSAIEDYPANYYLSMFPDCKNFLRVRDGEIVTSMTVEAINYWGIEHKLLGVTVMEGVGNSILDIQELENNVEVQNYLLGRCRLLTIPCMAEWLHDLFGFELSELVLGTSLAWFGYMTCSPLCKQKYQQVRSQLHLNPPSLGSRKWYLTFYLLEAALLFDRTAPNVEQTDPQLFTHKPSSDKVQAMEIFCKIARSIYQAIKVVSSPQYVFNSYFHVLWSVRTTLQELSTVRNIERIVDVGKMQENFDRQRRRVYVWLSMAVVLDPRYHINFIEQRFRQAFGNDAYMYISEVRGKLFELVMHYSCHVNQQNINTYSQMMDILLSIMSGTKSQNETNQILNGNTGQDGFREICQF
ncbi:zinc finger BED domain-containing protein RICESLEEPER 1-like [Oryza brachyantha]|uniref:hAT-like transposase RNase-H fold domain-containing protein n=1 Tax=Oryza brachyantha TaxID=4533 RepID=J3MR76_ORYBR|nr:zinc finger BED domain-containing protein RICESLEEPER 1-like [Oryza brachyantha]